MVAFALVVNMGRYEGWVIVGVGIVMAYYLRKNWFSGGRQPINLSHQCPGLKLIKQIIRQGFSCDSFLVILVNHLFLQNRFLIYVKHCPQRAGSL
jgi:hypothetical protein